MIAANETVWIGCGESDIQARRVCTHWIEYLGFVVSPTDVTQS